MGVLFFRAEFNIEQAGRSPLSALEREIELIDFVVIFVSKITKSYFTYSVTRNKEKSELLRLELFLTDYF